MRNLAGDARAEASILDELGAVGIEPCRIEMGHSEVLSTVGGKLWRFTFVRAWYYWVVKGPMPLDVARKLYEDPIGRRDVRVAGHCGCPPPDEWARNGFVSEYHIDSSAGLRLFVDAVRNLNQLKSRDAESR